MAGGGEADHMSTGGGGGTQKVSPTTQKYQSVRGTTEVLCILKISLGTSLVVQWLRPCASTAGTRVRSLVRKLRSRMLCSAAKKKRKKERKDLSAAMRNMDLRGTGRRRTNSS